jgi:hypothetical protein
MRLSQEEFKRTGEKKDSTITGQLHAEMFFKTQQMDREFRNWQRIRSPASLLDSESQLQTAKV